MNTLYLKYNVSEQQLEINKLNGQIKLSKKDQCKEGSAWESLQEIMTNRLTVRQIDQPTDGHIKM